MSGFPEIDIRIGAECLDIAPIWDTVMVATDPSSGDLTVRGEWFMADQSEAANIGGLRAQQNLMSSIAIQLFTDKYSTRQRVRGGTDPRGWWGDGIDLQPNEQAIGTELWTLMNGTLDTQVAAQAKDFVVKALNPLLVSNGGPVARFVVLSQPDLGNGRLDIPISAFSQDGELIFAQKWQFLWNQVGTALSAVAVPSFTIN